MYKTWGADGIDQQSKDQMTEACALPNAVAGALMPDAHLGYGLPIGGVLALENAISPYAVGYDIACRMKLTLFEDEPSSLVYNKSDYINALESQTSFGVGSSTDGESHSVMDQDWSITQITAEMKDRAASQLGSSGSGNHFVEFGVVRLTEKQAKKLGVSRSGEFLALMSHSGSRGAGHNVCTYYSAIAKDKVGAAGYDVGHGKLTWLDMDTEAGQEYWAAMNLMGDYAQANHDVIHDKIADFVGLSKTMAIDNHHNFAWKEIHDGKEVYVHRKGATPAGKGVLGIIPGSMGDNAYIVMGKGSEDSLCSASHGAGRLMSRRKGKETFNYDQEKALLEKRGVTILSAGADEVPGVYKNIEDVMNEQDDLVERLGTFSPVIVKMANK